MKRLLSLLVLAPTFPLTATQPVVVETDYPIFQSPSPLNPPCNWVEIRVNTPSNLCWDIPNGIMQVGQPVQLFPCHGGPNQKFRVCPWGLNSFLGISVPNGLCVRFVNKRLELVHCYNIRFDDDLIYLNIRHTNIVNDPHDDIDTAVELNFRHTLLGRSGRCNNCCLRVSSLSQGAQYEWNSATSRCDDRFDVMQNIIITMCRTFHPNYISSDFCFEKCPCNLHQGQCNDNGDCVPGLVCTAHTCCEPYAKSKSCSTLCPCNINEGPCSVDSECQSPLVCDGTGESAMCIWPEEVSDDSGCPDGYMCCDGPPCFECVPVGHECQ